MKLERALLVPMALVFMVFGMTGMAIPVLPLHVHQTLGMSSFIVGLVAGSQFAASLLSRLWSGHLCDRHGPGMAVRAGLLAAAASGLLYLLSLQFLASPDTSLVLLLLGRALLGGAESFVVTGGLAWAITAASPGESGRVMAWIGMAMYAAFAIGAPIGSALYASMGFTAIAVATLVVPLLALPLLRRIPARAAPAPHAPQSPAGVLRAVWRPGLGLALSSVGFSAITTFIALLFVGRGWTPSWAGFSAFAGAFVVARIVGGRLPDRIGGARIAMYSLLIEALGLTVVASAQTSAAAVIGAVLVGLGYSLVFPGFGLEIVRQAPAGHRALALGSYTACLDLALGVAGPALGLLADKAGLAAVFAASAPMVLLAAAVALVLMRRPAASLDESPTKAMALGAPEPRTMKSDAYDLIVVGSGAAGLSAACTAAALGQRVLVLEHSERVGGTTAISGGMVWIPDNHKMADAGLPDSPEAAREYLLHTVPGSPQDARMAQYLARGDEAIRFLESHTSLRLQPVRRYPDYYPDLPGATSGGRVLEPVPFDGRELGTAFAQLRDPLPEFMLFGGMMVSREDLPILRRVTHSPKAMWHAAKLLARYLRQRLEAHRGTSLVLGNALAARLFKSARDLGVEIALRTSVVSLVSEG